MPPFRFTRLGPKGANKQLGEPNRKKIGAAMAVSGGGQSQIPAGFTYLGQFIDHDLTFDKTSVMLGSNVTPAQLLQGRSPALDLDSLYGAGPADPGSAKFYEADGLHLKVGKTTGPTKVGFDLPRGAGNTNAKKRKAIIPDPRNDENLAVAQHHCAMIRFHNRVVDTQLGSVPAAQKFAKAREIVTKHYQWMVRTDYLPRVAAPGVVNDVFNNGRKAFEVGATPTDLPTMPIEFSVAAFRLGHAMVRAALQLERGLRQRRRDARVPVHLLGARRRPRGRHPPREHLDRGLPAAVRLRGGEQAEPGGAGGQVQPSDEDRHHDRRPAPAPTSGAIGLPANAGFNDPRRNLAFRNLTRAKMLKLATGQQMATFLKNKGVNLTKLTKRPGPERQQRRRPERAHAGSAAGAREGHAALVLHPARGRAQRRKAQGRGRPDSGGDVPSGDGGQ